MECDKVFVMGQGSSLNASLCEGIEMFEKFLYWAQGVWHDLYQKRLRLLDSAYLVHKQ